MGNSPLIGTDPSRLAGDYNDVGPFGGGGGDYSGEEGSVLGKLFGKIKGLFGRPANAEPVAGAEIEPGVSPPLGAGTGPEGEGKLCPLQSSEDLGSIQLHLERSPQTKLE